MPPGKGIALDYATALSTILQGILYGFSVFMFGATIYSLVRRRATSDQLSYSMLTTACLLFIFSTVHMGIDIFRFIDAFIFHRDTPDGPGKYFGDLGSSTWFVRNLVYTLQTLLGDGVVIYRCYIVWSSVWVIILPFMLWTSTLVTASGVLWFFGHAHGAGGHTDIFNDKLTRWITAFFSSSLAANILSTSLLAYRLWRVESQVSRLRTTAGPLLHIMRVVADSGAIYSSMLILIIAFFVSKSNIQTIMLDITMPIISICFYMIILRIRNNDEPKYASSRSHISALSTGHRETLRLQNLEVHLNTTTDVVTDSVKSSHGFDLDQQDHRKHTV
ncbi:hypothetical protein D9615_005722 [Tricholomella constricta]|uniref:Uncharacterized protein n=1 Tax=Tricholomella constricta TaxID=117010 RepID=A0A8H5HAM6_9AGAR|nr:hypothetical protein D9615_005722 [Tricholomella constricta]